MKTLRRVFFYMRHELWLLLLSLLLSAAVVGLTLYIPVLTGRAIDGILGRGQVDFALVRRCLLRAGAAALLAGAAQWFVGVCNNRMTCRIVRDIRTDAFERLQRLPLSYIDSHAHGDIVSRMIADVDTFADGLLMGFTQVFSGVATILGTLCFMLSIHPGIALVVVLITPLSLLVAAVIAKSTHAMFQVLSVTRGEQTSYVQEMIGNQKVVQAFGREADTEVHFAGINERLRSCSLTAVFFSSLTNPATRFVNNLVYAAVALTGALAAMGNPAAFTVGQLTCFLSYANQYTKPFNEISGVITELQNALACAERIFALIGEEPEAADTDSHVLGEASGRLSLSHVFFSYDPGQRLIEDLNLAVSPGQRVAIVGPTGCGKTTLINLLMRFYDADSGQIRVEEAGTGGLYAVGELTRGSLRANFGMVLQETWLKSGTIRENLTMGREDATEEEIIAAAKASHAHGFIRRLPNGYDTVIGEDGGSLSQGQKQLLCIARVMLCLPPMLILDEATSSIDTRTELRIQKAFLTMMEGRTSFIVAHRLSTVREADVILVMKDGKIIEQGNHKTLLEANGFYAGLYRASL